ncbi:endonuclease/exonuclease/phosphatase family protein [Colwellia piezophila]|uniref:endonuclease/exonuclease/phosphatase family protein n=1 Tax=Colwellia piezophila TaxID=211668 RepID=UPI00036A6C44|nr:endonuclease/exonuclease/phosphatase family protein [Colwellia piezophila]
MKYSLSRLTRQLYIVLMLLIISLTGTAQAITLKVMSYNVLYGFNHGKQLAAGSEWIASQQPDFLALQEMKGFSSERLSEVAKRWGHKHSYFYQRKPGLPLAFTSRLPISQIEHLDKRIKRGFLHLESGGINFIVVHMTSQKLTARQAETAYISGIIKQLITDGKKLIVLGDFNAMSPLDVKRIVSLQPLLKEMRDSVKKRRNLNNNQFDTSILQSYYDLGLHDSSYHQLRGTDKAHKLMGTFPTLVAKKSTDRQVQKQRLQRIDYILSSPNLANKIFAADIVNWHDAKILDQISDHYPVVMVLDL